MGFGKPPITCLSDDFEIAHVDLVVGDIRCISGKLTGKAWLLTHPGPDLGHSVRGSVAGREHGLCIATSSREGVRVTLEGVKGTACIVTGAAGAGDVAGAGGGMEGAGTGVGAVVWAHTSPLAWLHFFLALQKTLVLIPSMSRISSKKTKRVFLPLLTG